MLSLCAGVLGPVVPLITVPDSGLPLLEGLDAPSLLLLLLLLVLAGTGMGTVMGCCLIMFAGMTRVYEVALLPPPAPLPRPRYAAPPRSALCTVDVDGGTGLLGTKTADVGCRLLLVEGTTGFCVLLLNGSATSSSRGSWNV